MSAQWASLREAGLTYGDEFTFHGDTKRGFNPIGIRVRIERSPLSNGNGVRAIDVKTGEAVSQSTGIGRGKWWIVK